MSVGEYKWKAGGITSMWAAGMRTAAIHRATDWDGQNGTFEEYTDDGGGPRPSLVEGQEDYTFVDNNTAVGYAYKVQLHEPWGMTSDFSNVAVMGEDPTAVLLQCQKVAVRWVHPTQNLKGGWQEFNPTALQLTREKLQLLGNRPYETAKDYWLEFALLYQKTNETWEGINLSGVTEIALTVQKRDGTAVGTRKISDGEIIVLDQGTAHSAGGTEGHFLVKWEDEDVWVTGNHLVDCDTTDAGLIISQFAGEMDVLENA